MECYLNFSWTGNNDGRPAFLVSMRNSCSAAVQIYHSREVGNLEKVFQVKRVSQNGLTVEKAREELPTWRRGFSRKYFLRIVRQQLLLFGKPHLAIIEYQPLLISGLRKFQTRKVAKLGNFWIGWDSICNHGNSKSLWLQWWHHPGYNGPYNRHYHHWQRVKDCSKQCSQENDNWKTGFNVKFYGCEVVLPDKQQPGCVLIACTMTII